MKVTYYLEIMSSWCHWAELKQRFAGRVEFEWRIALMNPEDFPVSASQCEWFYRRSGMMMPSPYMLNTGWIEPSRMGHYEAPNHVAEAARDFGFDGDEVRLALTHAAVREGRRIGDLATAVKIAVQAMQASGRGRARVDAAKLRKAAESKSVRDRVAHSTAEFHAHRINQRPAFVLTDAIGDKAVFSGLVKAGPLAATIEAMLTDTAGYAAHAAHFRPPPEH